MDRQVLVPMTPEEAENLFYLAYAAKAGDIALPFKEDVMVRLRADTDDLVQRLFAASEAKPGEAGWDGDSPMTPEQAAAWATWANALDGQGLPPLEKTAEPDEGMELIAEANRRNDYGN